MSPNKRKTKKPSKAVINDDQKRQLAKLVEGYPSLWDLADPNHKHAHMHASHWLEISKDLKLSVSECKSVWRSLRDGLRYRKNPLKKGTKGKSGDSCPDYSSDNNDEISNFDEKALHSWKFWDCMQFYGMQKSTRRTISSLNEINENDEINEDNLNEAISKPNGEEIPVERAETPLHEESTVLEGKESASVSNYDYTVKRKRRLSNEDGTEKLAAGIVELINLRKEVIAKPRQKLVYASMYENLDRMLQQLPSPVVEDLNMEFLKLTHEAIKRQRLIIFE